MKKAYGFTIVELLIVIVVIAILAALSYVGYQGLQSKARDSQRKQDVASMVSALELYYADNGEYPRGSGSSSINGAWSTSHEPTTWEYLGDQLASYLPALPVDPLNTGLGGYQYEFFSSRSDYCESGVGQMYILAYRLESGEVDRKTVGSCSVNQVHRPHSYHRAAK